MIVRDDVEVIEKKRRKHGDVPGTLQEIVVVLTTRRSIVYLRDFPNKFKLSLPNLVMYF